MKSVPKWLAVFAVLLPMFACAQTQPPSLVFGPFGVTSTPLLQYQTAPFPVYGTGTMIVTASGLTGAASGCVGSVSFSSRVTNGATASVTLFSTSANISMIPAANGSLSYRLNPGTTASLLGPYSALAASFTCTTYPTSGSVILEYIPDSQPAYTYSHITTNASTIIHTFPSQVHLLTINQAGTGETITVFDNTTCTGTAVGIFTGFATGQSFWLDVTTNTGLCVLTAGTTPGDYTVTYR